MVKVKLYYDSVLDRLFGTRKVRKDEKNSVAQRSRPWIY